MSAQGGKNAGTENTPKYGNKELQRKKKEKERIYVG